MDDYPGSTSPTVLVVDDDVLHTQLLVSALQSQVPGIAVATAASVRMAHVQIDARQIDAVVLDVGLPDGDGLAVVDHVARRGVQIPFVLLTADGSAHTAMRALRAGAVDYVVKDGAAVARAVALVSDVLGAAPASVGGRPALVGNSRRMREVRAVVRRCARSDAPVRIEGETGVGKELVARSIHTQSPRRNAPFVAVNCGALPESLAEAELFGHVRGAYTGAASDRAGLVEHAKGGTLLLDEVEDLPRPIQGKLLRLLQEGEYRPVGTARVRHADVRLLAASNRDLGSMVDAGSFRPDLFYRLDVLRVTVPPLREREDDVVALLSHLLARGRGLRRAEFPREAELARLRMYPWPGNVRELDNFVERARAVAEIAGWRAGWVSALEELETATSSAREEAAVVAESPPEVPGKAELERLLARHRWHRESAARELGVSRVTLWRRMRRCGLLGEP